MKPASPIAISLNFDSLNEAYGFPSGFRDVGFFEGFDRIANLAGKFGSRLSTYVIGKDLVNAEHAARVREWHENGHEIGNHTWTHDYSLGSLTLEQIEKEIVDAHKRIAECTGVAPSGFIAPAWSTSRQVVSQLVKLGYKYDTSVFPSVYLYPLVLKSLLSHAGNWKKGVHILKRGDWHLPLVSPLEPYSVDENFKRVSRRDKGKLLIMPLAAQTRFHVCRWHTAGFFFGWDRHYAALEKLANTREGFYYLIHPADFLGPGDLSPQYSQYLERMEVPLAEKMRRLEEVFSILHATGRAKSTMREKADFLLSR